MLRWWYQHKAIDERERGNSAVKYRSAIKREYRRVKTNAMDKLTEGLGLLLVLAGLVGIAYGLGVNVPGMISRGASDYSFITAYVLEWVLVLIAGLSLIVKGLRAR